MPDEIERQSKESDSGSQPVQVSDTKPGRSAFANVRRELTEEELSSPGARRLLLHDRDRLDGEVATLRHFQERYYATKTEAEILKERLKTHVAIDICWGVGLSVGFGLMGIVANIWDKKPYAQILLTFSCVLIGGAIAMRFVKR